MALGFQDCCNSSSYFYLNGIPATVSEFETYYITTSQGENFCATYVDVPALNYLPPTYTLLEMTEYTDCDDCKTSNSYTCPTSETILISGLGAGSIATSDCVVKTIMPLYVECVSLNPGLDGGFDGAVSLYVSGGTPPYTFYSAGTTNAVGDNTDENNVFPIFQNLEAGTYNITTVDSNGDFSVTVSCTLENAPSNLLATCSSTNVTVNGLNDGTLDFLVSGGVPPYFYTYLGNTVTLPLQNLNAGTYNITITDSGPDGYQQSIVETCSITEPPVVNYPDNICMSFTICNNQMLLAFERDTVDINFRASYLCTNPNLVGLTNLSIYYGDNGWQTSQEIVQTSPQFANFCGINYLNQTFFAISYQPTNPLPIGSWFTNQGGLLTGVVPITVSSGICPVLVVVDAATTICLQTTPALGTVVLQAIGGTPPYTFYAAAGTMTQSNTSGNFLLSNGTYSITAQDSQGVQSQPISFTFPTNSGVDVLFGIDSCVTSTLTTSWINQISGPSATPVIQNGESRQLTALVSNTIDFSFLPNGAQFTGKIRILFSSNFEGGDTQFRLPIPSNIVVNPSIDTARITTNGVVNNFMNSVTPTTIGTPGQPINGTNGLWYPSGFANSCCPNTLGFDTTIWYQANEWISPTLTFNNTTILENIFRIYTKNSVPYINVNCADGNFCGGKLTNGIIIELFNLTRVSGCLNVSGTKKLVIGTVKNNSDGDADWVSQPIPIC